MFNLFKRKKRSDFTAPLIFKDAQGAFEYSCKFMTTTLNKGVYLPALVLSSQSDGDGIQIVTLRVSSDDGGFIALSQPFGAKGPKLTAGQLVAWQALKYSSDMAAKSDDKRSGWVGFIIATLKPEWSSQGWAIDRKFQ